MSKSPPQSGPKSPKSSTSGRSSYKRGSHKRNRSSQMNTLVSMLLTVDKLGERGREFSTTEAQKEADISFSQAYTWLQVLRAHKFVAARLVTSNRPSGDWRWTEVSDREDAMSKMGVAWFYVCTEEAAPILKKLFEAGVAPGSVTEIPAEDLKILNEGVSYFPIHTVDKSKIITGTGRRH